MVGGDLNCPLFRYLANSRFHGRVFLVIRDSVSGSVPVVSALLAVVGQQAGFERGSRHCLRGQGRRPAQLGDTGLFVDLRLLGLDRSPGAAEVVGKIAVRSAE